MSKKRGFFFVLLVVLLAFFAVQAFAEEGCYLYPSSESSFCHEIDRTQAATECAEHEDCDLLTHFVPLTECDPEVYTQCEEVTCTVDCASHALGWCELMGEESGFPELRGQAVPEGDIENWCQERCCQAGPYCSGEATFRWTCQLGALQVGLPADSFTQSLTETSTPACNAWCEGGVVTGSLSGFVFGRSASSETPLPLAGATVRLPTGAAVTTATDGSYTFSNIAAQGYRVTATAVGFGSQQQTVIVPADETIELNFTLGLPQSFSLSGLITGSEGEPLQATVSWEGLERDFTVANRSGFYTIGPLPAGIYNVTVSERDHQAQTQLVDLTSQNVSLDFQLQAQERQGLSGKVTIDGVGIRGALILLDNIVRGSSQEGGVFFIDAVAGIYDATAVLGGFGTLNPIEVLVRVGEVTTNVNLALHALTSDCPADTSLAVETLTAAPMRGENTLQLLWEKPCSDVIRYEIEQFSCTSFDSESCSASPTNTFQAGPVEVSFVDTSVEWEHYYSYAITTVYADGGRSSVTMSNVAYVGDTECSGHFNGRWDFFCLPQQGEATTNPNFIWTCTDENVLIQQADCSLTGEYCAPADGNTVTCKSDAACLSSSTAFGLYQTAESCYGTATPLEGTANFCTLNVKDTIVDACVSCTEVVKCSDYQTQDACEINSCLGGSTCQWFDVAEADVVDYSLIFGVDLPQQVTGETGKGYCGQVVPEIVTREDSSCSLCGPEGDVFENNYCTAEVCSALGACYSTNGFSTCASCPSQADDTANCYTYVTELECTGGQGISITSGQVTPSQDQCGWNQCAWDATLLGSCFKDGNGDGVDDCDGVPSHLLRQCQRDVSPPFTQITSDSLVLSTVSPELSFTARDDQSLGTFHYCLLDAEGSAYCDEEKFQENSIDYTLNLREETITLGLLEKFTELADRKTYRLQYYSIDRFKNQENVHEAYVIIDNKAPLFTLETTQQTIGDQSTLQVNLVGPIESAECVFSLQQELPRGSLREQQSGFDEQTKAVTFTDLPGVEHQLTVTCTDKAGNVAEREQKIIFDHAPSIELVKPEINAALSSTRVDFEVHTAAAAICELRDKFTDAFIAAFATNTDAKVHTVTPERNFFPGAHDEVKVVCTQTITRDVETEYLYFIVDVTPPVVYPQLREGSRLEEPRGFNWEVSFLEQAAVGFVCEEDGGIPCEEYRYCLGDDCPLTRKSEFALWDLSPVLINESTELCYYGVDEAGFDGHVKCGSIHINGFGITLVQPPGYTYEGEQWGVSNETIFDVEFYTQVPTQQCWYDFIPGFSSEGLPAYKHLEHDSHNRYHLFNFPNSTFTEYDGPEVKTLYVLCEDLTGKQLEQPVHLEYDPSAPEIIDAYAEPETVVEGVYTDLFISTDDKTVCRFSDNSTGTGTGLYDEMDAFDEDEHVLQYSHQKRYHLTLTEEQKDFSLLIACQNGAGLLSDTEELTFSVDYTIAGAIISLSPSGTVATTEITLEAVTNKNAVCSYKPAESYQQMSGAGGTVHTVNLANVTEGAHTYPIRCSIAGNTREGQIQFTVDLTPPTITSIEDGTLSCGLNILEGIFINTDENVTAFNYELYKEAGTGNSTNITTTEDELIASGTVSASDELIFDDLDLEEDAQYYLRARAQDAAGFVSEWVTSDGFIATTDDDVLCENDHDLPMVQFVTNTSCVDVTTRLECQDDVGCRSLDYGTSFSSVSCTPSQAFTGNPLTFDESMWVCYQADDRSGNNGTLQFKRIVFPDDDGDGIANSCDLCGNTATGAVVDGDGCSAGQLTPGQQNVDTDGDGLPDNWEQAYNAVDCALQSNNQDSDSNGITDADEDYDGDGITNYQEYLALGNPCLVDPPADRGGDSSVPPVGPPSSSPDVAAITLLILGLLFIAGGSGYLIWYYKKQPVQPKKSSFSPRPVYSGSSQQQEPKGIAAWKERLLRSRRQQSAKNLQRERASVFGEFTQQSAEIPHITEALQSRKPHLTRLQDLAEKYADHKKEIKQGLQPHEEDVFARLGSIAQQTKRKPIASVVSQKEAKDIFTKLRAIAKKRKSS